MDLFACRRGTVVTMKGCEGLPGKLVLQGFENPVAALIESPTVRHDVNIQFMPSLDDAVYAYVFGDKMGQVTIRGVAFAGLCTGSGSGLKELDDYYKNHRASQREDVVAVTIGNVTQSGFLTGMVITSRDPKFMLLDFEMTINTLPKKRT
jgi:hypothetical protein